MADMICHKVYELLMSILRYDTNPPAIQEQQWHSREAQIELDYGRKIMIL
jgi:hypothetical protein